MSFKLFCELAGIIGSQRMVDLCEMYIQSQKGGGPVLDISGYSVWSDCSGQSASANINCDNCHAMRGETYTSLTPARFPSRASQDAPGAPSRPAFHSPSLVATPAPPTLCQPPSFPSPPLFPPPPHISRRLSFSEIHSTSD